MPSYEQLYFSNITRKNFHYFHYADHHLHRAPTQFGQPYMWRTPHPQVTIKRRTDETAEQNQRAAHHQRDNIQDDSET